MGMSECVFATSQDIWTSGPSRNLWAKRDGLGKREGLALPSTYRVPGLAQRTPPFPNRILILIAYSDTTNVNECVHAKGTFQGAGENREEIHSTPYLYQASSLVGEDQQPWKKMRMIVLRQLHKVERQGMCLRRVALAGGWAARRRKVKGLVSAHCLPYAQQQSTGKPDTN